LDRKEEGESKSIGQKGRKGQQVNWTKRKKRA